MPAIDSRPFDTALKRMYRRVALDGLTAHLASTYGIEVATTEQLDVGVIRIDRRDGPAWIARVFSALRPAKATAGDAAVLRYLERCDFPAERLATKKPISTMAGQEVLVTEFIEKEKRLPEPGVDQAKRSRAMGWLHSLPKPKPKGAAARPAGGLHHFCDGSRRDELRGAASWLDQIADKVPPAGRGDLDRLRSAILDADDGEGLPTAVIHPDPVGKNMVRTPGGFTYIDWTGAGVGPRTVSLEWMIGPGNSGAGAIRGYSEHLTLTDEEWNRLPGIGESRKLVNLAFTAARQPEQIPRLVKRLASIRREKRKRVAAARAGCP